MHVPFKLLGYLTFLCAIVSATSAEPEHSSYTSDWVTRDVAIIGGGASGTYAAWRLRQLQHSVAIIEAKSRLGGHADTYITPEGVPIDYGVRVFHDSPLVKRFFAHFGIPLTKTDYIPPPTTPIDLRTGKIDTTFTQPDPSLALQAYAAQLAKYPFLREGFDLPEPVPEDLLIPFGAFAEKHGLTDAVPLIAQYNEGIGDILTVPTLYVMKYFGLDLLEAIADGFLVTSRGNNSEIYSRAEDEFRGDVWYNTKVLWADRENRDKDGYMHLILHGPKTITRLRAKQLLITAPPSLSNLQPFGFSARDRALFARFRANTYWAGVLHAPGLPALAVRNAAPTRPYHLPQLPGAYSWSPAAGAPAYSVFTYGGRGGERLSDEAVKTDVLGAVQRALKAGSLGQAGNRTIEEMRFVAFADHSPYEVMVDAGDVRRGFYRDLKALQGRWGTWWSGAAFETHDSSLIWRFTEGLVGNITERL